MTPQKTKFKQTEIGLIPEEWEVKSIEDVASFVNEKINVLELDISNFISTENMLPNKGGVTNYSLSLKDGKATKFKEGDILFSNIRTYFKKIWLSKFTGGCSNDVLVIRSKHINNKYLFYNLSQEKFFEFTVLTSKGTKMPRGDKKSILRYKIPIPPLPEQRAIAKILSDLDAKIELNQQMNKTLEAIGQALFKHWFVDFEFPNEEGKPYKSSGGRMVYNEELGKEIPEGWRVKELKDIVLRIGPGTNFQPKRIKEGIPFLNVKNISNGFLDLKSIKYISEKDFKWVHKNWLPEEHDILISRIGTLGNVAIIRKDDLPLSVHYNIIDIKPKNTSHAFLYFLLTSSFFQKEFHLRKVQTVQEYITIENVETIKIPLPDMNVLKLFDSYFLYIISKLEINFSQSLTLSRIRDALLPKLMSGKIHVPVDEILNGENL